MYVILNEKTGTLVLDRNGHIVELEHEEFALKVARIVARRLGVITRVMDKATLLAAIEERRK